MKQSKNSKIESNQFMPSTQNEISSKNSNHFFSNNQEKYSEHNHYSSNSCSSEKTSSTSKISKHSENHLSELQNENNHTKKKSNEQEVSVLDQLSNVPTPSFSVPSSESHIPSQYSTIQDILQGMKGFSDPNTKPIICHCEELNKNLAAEIVLEKDDQLYIHFIDQDKRLDRWISRSMILPDSDATPITEIPKTTTFTPHQLDDPRNLSEYDIKFDETHRRATRVRNINEITISGNTFRTWYYSPYPYPFFNCEHLYICEHCFQYFASEEDLQKHMNETKEFTPPGYEIYRKENISIFQIHGQKQKIACQNLCLLAKLFLDHKTLCYDVEMFVFYILCEVDEKGAHFAAYCSRQLDSDVHNVLACIVCLPPYQKKGYGRLLIELTQEIAKRRRMPGGPERPLSDLGRISYYSYWRDAIVQQLRDNRDKIETIMDLVRLTAIGPSDVIDTLRDLNCVILDSLSGEYMLKINDDYLQVAIKKLNPNRRHIDTKCLIWLQGDDDGII